MTTLKTTFGKSLRLLVYKVLSRKKRRSDRLLLERMSDHMLKDIGISRSQIFAAVGGDGIARTQPCGPKN